MKTKFLLYFLCSLFSTNCFAQLYNQLNQDAYNTGYKAGYGMGCYFKGVTALCEERFDDAYDLFWEGADYNFMNYEGLGIMHELGLGRSKNNSSARNFYEIGAENGNYTCKLHLQRIKQSGYWPKSYKDTFLKNLRIAQNVNNGTTSNSNGGIFNYGGSSSSNGGSSTYRTCSSCNGTGTCSSCHGRGGEWQDTGYYSGTNSKTWFNCPSCNGSKRCFNCHGSGRI